MPSAAIRSANQFVFFLSSLLPSLFSLALRKLTSNQLDSTNISQLSSKHTLLRLPAARIDLQANWRVCERCNALEFI